MQTLVEPTQRAAQYVAIVQHLYELVVKWQPATIPDAKISQEPIDLIDSQGNKYTIPQLVIQRPLRGDVRFVPKGYNIIGAAGRIDLEGPRGFETLVYLEDGGPVITWKEITEGGHVISSSSQKVISDEIAEGWHWIQNKRLMVLPTPDQDLLLRLLEVIGR